MPGYKVDEPCLLAALALAVDKVPIDARLKSVLIVWEGIEAEVEESLAVVLADGVRKQIAKEALLMMRVAEAAEGSEWSHLVLHFPPRSSSACVRQA